MVRAGPPGPAFAFRRQAVMDGCSESDAERHSETFLSDASDDPVDLAGSSTPTSDHVLDDQVNASEYSSQIRTGIESEKSGEYEDSAKRTTMGFPTANSHPPLPKRKPTRLEELEYLQASGLLSWEDWQVSLAPQCRPPPLSNL